MTQIEYKRFDLQQVGTSGESVSLEPNFSAETVSITGVALTSDRPQQCFYRGMIGLRIDSKEIFPDDFPGSMLMAGANTEPEKKFLRIKIEDPHKAKIIFKDEDNQLAPFTAYKPIVILRIETKIK